jgi:hypothetical protein
MSVGDMKVFTGRSPHTIRVAALRQKPKRWRLRTLGKKVIVERMQ